MQELKLKVHTGSNKTQGDVFNIVALDKYINMD